MQKHPLSDLHWLPLVEGHSDALRAAQTDPSVTWQDLRHLAEHRLNASSIRNLDRKLQSSFSQPEQVAVTEPVRLGILGSTTIRHLLPSIRVHGLRRGLHITVHEGQYDQIMQPLLDPASDLRKFEPNALLLALDANYLCAGFHSNLSIAAVEARYQDLWRKVEDFWKLAKGLVSGPVLHQAPLPTLLSILGQNEHRLIGSPAAVLARFSADLRARADNAGIQIISVDQWSSRQGIHHWHDPVLWRSAKQEISSAAAPLYGDLVVRVLAAASGRVAKCLVVDLDNTMWGGVIGDDGLEALRLGPGSAEGEAFLAAQRYVLELKRRGIVIAVCSKNEMSTAEEPFGHHPEMLLQRSDISCFVANWQNKADNLRQIASELNLGLDALVFLDDNPAERDLIRRELPEVSVPEFPDDPIWIPQCLSDAGYFEALSVTSDDLQRSSHYKANSERETLRAASSDMGSYLQSLEMRLQWGTFDKLNMARATQLMKKTNQFNLTTRRHGDTVMQRVQHDPLSSGLRFRLQDRFGDNGLIAVVILTLKGSVLAPTHLQPGDALIDTWLMSCRVIGRRVEEATLDVVVATARKLGALRLVGVYLPTQKNGLVADHYIKLGFSSTKAPRDDIEYWHLDLETYQPSDLPIEIDGEPAA